MGLFGDIVRSRRIDEPVRGEARVLAATDWRAHDATEKCKLRLEIEAPGIAATTIDYQCIVRAGRWPEIGQVLPVTLDRRRPNRLRIEWDEVPPNEAVVRFRAESLGTVPPPAPPPAPTPAVVVAEPAVAVASAGPAAVEEPAPPPPAAADERLDQLERLGRLRDSGVLTTEEFETEKRRILAAP